jgi:arylsulfatase A-like enzyme
MFSNLMALGVATTSLLAHQGWDERPNVILITADDLGYHDVGFMGCPDIPTPNIDRIANTGVKFSSAYVTQPVCSPSRAGIITGRYPETFGYYYNDSNYFSPDQFQIFGLPADVTTLADRLGAQGYPTGLVGKWHLGFVDGRRPHQRGFQESFALMGAGGPYFPWAPDQATYRENGQIATISKYSTWEYTDRAVDFVKKHGGTSRFFLQLNYTAPHVPRQAMQALLDRFPNLPDGRREYAAQVAAMDDGIGKLYKVLDGMNIVNNTMIIFLSDNGGEQNLNHRDSNNYPLRGSKGSLFEGGIRVPMALSWPRYVQSGITYTPMVSSMDIVPTAMAAAGIYGSALEGPIDGRNLLPVLRQKDPLSFQPHQALFWRYKYGRAVRYRDLKYVRYDNGIGGNGIPFEGFYNLATNIGETKNLIAVDTRQDDILKLRTMLAQWEAPLVRPLWPGPNGEW